MAVASGKLAIRVTRVTSLNRKARMNGMKRDPNMDEIAKFVMKFHLNVCAKKATL